MPNHVAHRITVMGPPAEIEKILARHFHLTPSGRCLDFNTFDPMPACLEKIDGVSGYHSPLVEWMTGKVYNEKTFEGGRYGQKTKMAQVTDAIFKSTWDKAGQVPATPHAALEIIKALHPREYEHARLGAEGVALCGLGDPLVFARERWGTKWNAYDGSVDIQGPDRFEMVFSTAWSCPEPIFGHLAKTYPFIAFWGHAFDEGWNFEATIAGVQGVAGCTSRKATDALYEVVYGHPPDKQEEDGAGAS
jgi:hypothetical protein